MSELVEELKRDLQDEEARYAYADTVTNAFVTAQIKALREERGLTQAELADLIGTKQSGISRLLQKDYSSWKVETLRKLARAFGVRLRVRLEEFGTLPDEIKGFNPKNLAPRKFENDPVFNEQISQEPEGVAVAALRANGMAQTANAKVGEIASQNYAEWNRNGSEIALVAEQQNPRSEGLSIQPKPPQRIALENADWNWASRLLEPTLVSTLEAVNQGKAA